LIAIFVLSLSYLDKIIFFPTNCQKKYGILTLFTAVILRSVYEVKLTYFSSWLHFKENETNLRTMACTKVNLTPPLPCHPPS